MSRLWLERLRAASVGGLGGETIRVGLFPGESWLKRGSRKAAAQSFDTPPFADPRELLDALDAALTAQPTLKKGSRVVLTVSDGVAAIVTLPWQETLQRQEEIESYARICFEKQGVMLEGDYIVHAEFRQYRGMGLACALPRAWLEQLLTILGAKGLRLAAVQPVSAAAYCSMRLKTQQESPVQMDVHKPKSANWLKSRFEWKRRSGNARTLLLLQERHHATAMTFGATGLLDYDVEPLTGSATDARQRLLARVMAVPNAVEPNTTEPNSTEPIMRVKLWSPALSEADAAKAGVVTLPLLPTAEVNCVSREAWN